MAWVLACSAITCTTMLLARPSSTTAGQCGLAHPHDSTVEPAPRAPSASERRWARVRGSSSHTPRAIAATRCLSRAASGPSSRPYTAAVPVGIGVGDGEVAGAGTVAGAPHRGGVDPIDPDVDGLGEFVLGQRTPRDDPFGDDLIECGDRCGAGDQVGAVGDQPHPPRVELPGQEQGGHLREPVAQHHRQIHLPAGAAVADVECGGDLGGRGGLIVTRPAGMLAGVAAPRQLRDRGVLAGIGGRPQPRPAGDRVDHRGIIGPAKLVHIDRQIPEHMFDSTSTHRQTAWLGGDLPVLILLGG